MTLTDADDDFAALWREASDAEDDAVVRAMARRAGWQARALLFAEVGLALILIVAIALAMGASGAPATLLFGLMLAGAIVWQMWKRRTLYEASFAHGVNDRDRLLSAAQVRTARELRQARWALLWFPLGFALAALMKATAAVGGDVTTAVEALRAASATPETRVALLALALGEGYFFQRALRLAGELKRIILLRDDYRREAEIDASDAR